MYASTLKQLLGVRATTCTDLSINEAGEDGAVALVRQRQRKFITRVRNSNDYDRSQIARIIELAIRVPARQVLKSIGDDDNDLADPYTTSVRDSSSSHRVAYQLINPTLERSAVFATFPSITESPLQG